MLRYMNMQLLAAVIYLRFRDVGGNILDDTDGLSSVYSVMYNVSDPLSIGKRKNVKLRASIIRYDEILSSFEGQ